MTYGYRTSFTAADRADREETIVDGRFSSSGDIAISDGSVTQGAIYFADDKNTGIYSPSNDSIAFTTAGSAALTIANNTATFAGDLTISNTSPQIFLVDSNNDSDYEIGNEDGLFRIRDTTNAANRLEISSTGDATFAGTVLVGRTSAGNTGNGHTLRYNDSAIFSRDSGGETMQVCRNATAGDLIRWYQNGSWTDGNDISISSGVVSYNTTSDYRLKENEVAISDGITRLKLLKPYRFNYKNNPSKTMDGFFAHEVTPAVPEAIKGTKDAVYPNGDLKTQGIDQSKLVPLLTAALQEAIAKIETLETKVAALEST